tara:strand:+ start:1815 stop:2882 length:1068 start_codon:yes stop_codon:yes gene_type:complete
MYQLLKNKVYYLFINFFYKFGHLYNPKFNTLSKYLHAEQTTFFDLQGQFNIDSIEFEKNCLISVIDRKDKYLNKNKYIFESWTKNKNHTYSDNADNYYNHKKKILKSFLEKSSKEYKKKIFLLPYYHNQAGHFMGEVFGSMLFYLELFKKRNLNEKLLIICPSQKWEQFFNKIYKKNIILFPDNFFLKKNISFSRSAILPKFHPFQNYIVAKNILSEKIENTDFRHKKIFLTSERSQRISNISEVINYLKKKNFTIINPKKFSILELFKILNSAKTVVSESGSISHNIHLSRNKSYYLLLPSAFKVINKKWYRITTIFNNFHSCLYKPIYFESHKTVAIPLQEQILVDLRKLKFL